MSQPGENAVSVGIIAAMRASSGNRSKPRSVIDLADEIAELYHRDGIRSFELTGGCPLPSEERSALRWIGGLKRILASREVGRIAVGMTTRQDRLTPRVTEALTDLGYATRPIARVRVDAHTADVPHQALAAG